MKVNETYYNTEEEILNYVKGRYPIGTIFNSLNWEYANITVTNLNEFSTYRFGDLSSRKIYYKDDKNNDRLIFLSHCGKDQWAEIVSSPTKKEKLTVSEEAEKRGFKVGTKFIDLYNKTLFTASSVVEKNYKSKRHIYVPVEKHKTLPNKSARIYDAKTGEWATIIDDGYSYKHVDYGDTRFKILAVDGVEWTAIGAEKANMIKCNMKEFISIKKEEEEGNSYVDYVKKINDLDKTKLYIINGRSLLHQTHWGKTVSIIYKEQGTSTYKVKFVNDDNDESFIFIHARNLNLVTELDITKKYKINGDIGGCNSKKYHGQIVTIDHKEFDNDFGGWYKVSFENKELGISSASVHLSMLELIEEDLNVIKIGGLYNVINDHTWEGSVVKITGFNPTYPQWIGYQIYHHSKRINHCLEYFKASDLKENNQYEIGTYHMINLPSDKLHGEKVAITKKEKK